VWPRSGGRDHFVAVDISARRRCGERRPSRVAKAAPIGGDSDPSVDA
jgi:hypothetical protein